MSVFSLNFYCIVLYCITYDSCRNLQQRMVSDQRWLHIRAVTAWLRQRSARQTDIHNHWTTTACHQCCCETSVPSRDHYSVKTKLYWLPVDAHIEFNLRRVIHLTVIGKAPTYTTDLCSMFLHCHIVMSDSFAFAHKVSRVLRIKNASEVQEAHLRHSNSQCMEQTANACLYSQGHQHL